jgi:hypothetical protein
VGGIVLGSVGAATLITSIALGVVALGKKSELEELACEERGDQLACDPGSYDSATALAADGRTLATVSTVTTFVGAAALGAGALMLALGAGSSSAPAVGVVPWGDAESAGLVVLGRFR